MKTILQVLSKRLDNEPNLSWVDWLHRPITIYIPVAVLRQGSNGHCPPPPSLIVCPPPPVVLP